MHAIKIAQALSSWDGEVSLENDGTADRSAALKRTQARCVLSLTRAMPLI